MTQATNNNSNSNDKSKTKTPIDGCVNLFYLSEIILSVIIFIFFSSCSNAFEVSLFITGLLVPIRFILMCCMIGPLFVVFVSSENAQQFSDCCGLIFNSIELIAWFVLMMFIVVNLDDAKTEQEKVIAECVIGFFTTSQLLNLARQCFKIGIHLTK